MYFVLGLLLLAELGCGGSDSPMAPSEAGMVRLEVTGTTCSGNVKWVQGDSDNYPGDDVDFPWALSAPGYRGERVQLVGCNTCYLTCPSPPCAVTITTTVYWEGAMLATQTETDFPITPGCQPATFVNVYIP